MRPTSQEPIAAVEDPHALPEHELSEDHARMALSDSCRCGQALFTCLFERGDVAAGRGAVSRKARSSGGHALKALITGITGQDGSYLAELLLAQGYEVHGLIRRSSSFNTGRIDHVYEDPQEPVRRLTLHHGDLHDGAGIVSLLARIQPDAVYHLGAQSPVRVSFHMHS